jgi:peptidoglycan/LPS O-acetylase OafA/YrhL
MQKIFRFNNFDLIRLLAALLVTLSHVLYHLELKNTLLLHVCEIFPGVPIFFFISGFLISKSFENNSFIREYAHNRLLRLYPGLIVCTFTTILSVYLTGYFSNINLNFLQVFTWIAGQISFVQFYNPDFMRGFGTGVLNGSLWSITVELQFYILIPVLYWVLNKAEKKRVSKNLVLAILLVFFMAINIIHNILLTHYSDIFLFKLWRVSFSPWFYMFLVGVVFQRNFVSLHRRLEGKFFFILIAYITVVYFMKNFFAWQIGNSINPLLYLLLASLVFSLAYSLPSISDKYLRKNDISYGIYIYHIPVINLLLYYGYTSKPWFALFGIIITIAVACVSWFCIEKPALKLKKRPLNPL